MPASEHFTTRLATKRIAADCLFRSSEGHLLLVKPTYKEPWDLPGGLVERDESPRCAAQREVREELGITVEPGRLLAVDWLARRGEFTEVLALLFDGGQMAEQTLARCTPDPREIREIRFVELSEAAQLLEAETFARVSAAVHAQRAGQSIYLEDGVATRTTPTTLL